MSERVIPPIHGPDHAPGGPDPLTLPPPYHIKVFKDSRIILVGDARWILTIPRDVDEMVVDDVEISVTTVSSSGIVRVQLRNIDNGNVDILSTRAQVDVSETHSKTASVQPVVNTANADVTHGDRIAIDVDDAGTGAKGLEVVIFFGLG